MCAVWVVLIVGSILFCAFAGIPPEKFLIGWAIALAAYFLLKLMWVIIRAVTEKEPSDKMTTSEKGWAYENKTVYSLRSAGFQKVTVTGRTGDYGVDIIAERNGIRWAIQCKESKNLVSLKAVQEVYAGKTFYGCNFAAVVTNNSFTQSARELAKETGVVLLEHDDLSWIDRIEEYNAMM